MALATLTLAALMILLGVAGAVLILLNPNGKDYDERDDL